MDNLKGPERAVSAVALYLALVPVLLLAGIVIALHLILPPGPAPGLGFEPPLLLPILNTVFLFFASGLVAYVAGRSYLLSGSTPILFLGCGVLTLSLGALVAGWGGFRWRLVGAQVLRF